MYLLHYSHLKLKKRFDDHFQGPITWACGIADTALKFPSLETADLVSLSAIKFIPKTRIV